MASHDTDIFGSNPLDESSPEDDPLAPLPENDPMASLPEEDPLAPLPENDPLASLPEEDPLAPLPENDPLASLPEEDPLPSEPEAPAPKKPRMSAAATTQSTSAEKGESTLAVGVLPPKRQLHIFRSMAPCMLSMLVHAAMLLVLALLVVGSEIKEKLSTVVAEIIEDRPEDEIQDVFLEEETDPATEITAAELTSAPAAGLESSLVTEIPTLELDNRVVEQFETAAAITVDFPADMAMPKDQFIKAVPDGALGESRAVVDNYQQALSRVSQELMWMLEKSNVLVVWAFDESGSMKDDQQEIRERVYAVYAELGLTDNTDSDALTTAVTSYGAEFHVLTEKATSDLKEIKAAINAVQVDTSGQEMMCQAVGMSIVRFQKEARKEDRQMALILVTDESGNPANNIAQLELAIKQAQTANCRVYVMGREASFGYPYVYIRWIDPVTNRPYWLQLDRGPETAFPEQLQTNGFWRRYDSFSSGFGPYEQARLARETNGVFFMLPTIETNLVGGQKRRYELEAKKAYRPDLRPRQEVLNDRDKNPLRKNIWKVISDLNPYNAAAAKHIVMLQHFSLDKAKFIKQANDQHRKAVGYVPYLARAEKVLKDIDHLRQQEGEPRWQANYDLIYAQLITYQARMYEYMACLKDFLEKPTISPSTKMINGKPYLLRDLHIVNVKPLKAEAQSKPLADRAQVLFKQVIKDHPGTPWAARAQWELSRGFGVDLRPYYYPAYRDGKATPRPKL